jgi:hypothetical protein
MAKIQLAPGQFGALNKADYRVVPATGGAAIHLARYGDSWDAEPVKYASIRRAFMMLDEKGLFSKIQQMCWMAMDESGSLMNWIVAGPAATNVGMVLGALGFEGNGVSAYINTGLNPTTAAGAFSRDAAHFGVYLGDNSGNANSGNPAVGLISGTNLAVLYPKSLASNGSTAYRLNSATTQTFINPKYGQPGFMLVNRGGANTTRMLHDEDVVHSTNSNPSTANANGTLAIGRMTTSYGGGKYVGWTFGGGLSVAAGEEAVMAKACALLGRAMTSA